MRTIQKIRITDDAYPPTLRTIHQPPKILYVWGATEALHHSPAVAIVGTRRATRYGLETARILAPESSGAGIAVVSGLALGIDAAAHAGALEGNAPTVAVLGSGINQILRSNERLAEEIVARGGAVISEFEPDMPAEKWTFPQRNRIVAGLTQATIVVEAPEKSGALITARLAMDANRDVGAVPGEITSIVARGSNQLLKDGAALIRSLDDIRELLGMPLSAPTLDNLGESDDNLLRHLEIPLDAETLALQTRIPAAELFATLTRLELAGLVKNTNGIFHKI